MESQTAKTRLKGSRDPGGYDVAIAVPRELLDYVLVVEPRIGPDAGPGGSDGFGRRGQARSQVRQGAGVGMLMTGTKLQG